MESKREMNSDVKEDKALPEKMRQYQQITNVAVWMVLICNPLYLVLLCFEKYLNKTVVLVCSGFIIFFALCELVLEIVCAVNLSKLKKQGQGAHNATSSSEPSGKDGK